MGVTRTMTKATECIVKAFGMQCYRPLRIPWTAKMSNERVMHIIGNRTSDTCLKVIYNEIQDAVFWQHDDIHVSDSWCNA